MYYTCDWFSNLSLQHKLPPSIITGVSFHTLLVTTLQFTPFPILTINITFIFSLSEINATLNVSGI